MTSFWKVPEVQEEEQVNVMLVGINRLIEIFRFIDYLGRHIFHIDNAVMDT
jgi:hypothetical protein